LRFTASIVAYATFFLKSVYMPTDARQELTDASLALFAFWFLIPVLIRGPSIKVRVAALLVALPAALFFGLFLYGLIYDLCHCAYPQSQTTERLI
jgi:O-antigen ligase